MLRPCQFFEEEIWHREMNLKGAKHTPGFAKRPWDAFKSASAHS